MGNTYSVTCPKCSWTGEMHLGQGLCDRRRADEALIAMQTGPDAASMQSMLLTSPDLEMRLERVLYFCRACGRYQIRLTATFRNPYSQTSMSRVYRCDECGGMLARVRPHLIRRRPCPQCGGDMLWETTGEWEIAPAAELREAPLAEPESAVLLAEKCLAARDDKGRDVFIPIKTDEQLERLKRGESFAVRELNGLKEASASAQGYWALISPGAPLMLATFPARMIAVGEDEISALESALARALPAYESASLRSVYLDVEPLNIVGFMGAQGLFGYRLWTAPELEALGDSIRATLQNRNKLNI